MNPEERVEVVRFRPSQRRWKRLVGLVLLVALLASSYWLGQALAVRDRAQMADRESQLQQENAALKERLDDREQRLVNVERGAEVDRQVIEEVRQALRAARQNAARLEEEITFYKGLMDPSAASSGLEVHSFTVLRRADSPTYQFKLLVRQVASQHNLLKGSVQVGLTGQRHGEEVSIALAELSPDIGDENIVLRFRYFQAIEGTLTLPPDFQPKHVHVQAATSGNKPQKVEKLLDWAPQQI